MKINIRVQEFKNINSGQNLLKDSTPEILEYDPNILTLESSDTSSTLGQMISFRLIIHFGEDKVDFSALGKVETIKTTAERKVRLTLRLYQYDRFTWKRLMTALRECQERVDTVLKAVKGEDG